MNNCKLKLSSPYLPAFVIIISVPNSLNRSHSSFPSRMTSILSIHESSRKFSPFSWFCVFCRFAWLFSTAEHSTILLFVGLLTSTSSTEKEYKLLLQKSRLNLGWYLFVDLTLICPLLVRIAQIFGKLFIIHLNCSQKRSMFENLRPSLFQQISESQ